MQKPKEKLLAETIESAPIHGLAARTERLVQADIRNVNALAG